ncbi:response regulator [Shewanella gelidimarina]|uniref:response regulator n=1 Tax=Shewanella gelidimarina TaxID=56813 RepID=UPI00200D0A67|nr:response regulator [Shewanella gelidimarina]MCL1058893.1 response regulator [Shewanella gelidimarina]
MENVLTGITLLGLFILLVGLFLQLKRAVNQDISIFFKLKKNRIFAGLSLLVFTLILQLVGAIGLSITYDHEVNKSGEALRTLTKTTDVALSSWVKGWESRVTAVSSNPLLQARTQKLITESVTHETLIESDNLIWSRDAYQRYSESFGSLGFFITSLEGINLSSARDENVATENIVARKVPNIFARAVAGETVITAPIRSEVVLANPYGIEQTQTPTMFVLSPIRDAKGNVLAVLMLRIDPYIEFAKLAESAGVGKTGESYFVSQEGYILSHSRFEKELQSLGLVQPGQMSVLNLRVTNPGKTLTPEAPASAEHNDKPLTYSANQLSIRMDGHNYKGYRDYRGKEVIGAWHWDSRYGFGVITEMDLQEAASNYVFFKNIIIGIMSAIVLLCVLLSFGGVKIGRLVHDRLQVDNENLEREINLRTKELKDREKALWDLYENSVVAYASVSPSGRFIKHNRQFSLLAGVEREEFSRLKWRDIATEENRLIDDVYQQALKGVKTQDARVQLVDVNEKVMFVSISTDLAFDSERKVTEVRFSLLDISEQENVRLAMLENQQQYQVLLENIQGVVYRYKINVADSIEYKLEYLSPNVEVVTGYQDSDFLGENPRLSFADMVVKEDMLQLRDVLGKAYKTHSFVTQDVRILTASDELRFLQIKAQFVQDTLNNTCYFDGTIFDITEQKLAENRLHLSEDKLTVAAESARMGMWDYYPKDNKVVINRMYANMLGYDVQDLCIDDDQWSALMNGEQTWLQLIHADDRVLVLDHLSTHSQSNSQIFKREFRMRRKDGGYDWIMSIGQVHHYTEDGHAGRISGVHLNINESKELQRELAAAIEKADDANRAKGDFLANMSHEIRTPMNAIIGMTHLALKTELTRQQYNYIDKSHRSAQSLLGIINDILDFSKIEAGKLDLETINFRLEDVLDDIINLIGIKVAEKELELLFDIDPTIPAMLKGDPLRLAQILTNLANNAVKFTEHGSVILAVNTESLTDDEITLKFTVTDSGIGMTLEQQQDLFKPFSQADASTTRKYGGTGLGLAICKNLADLMGGEIGVSSELNVGSRFYFECVFPIVEHHDTAPIYQGDLEDVRVLLVEDNASSREILLAMLSTLKVQVDYAKDGMEAVEMLKASEASPYQLALLDWKMPKLDGIEVARFIEQLPASITPHVVMVTAYGKEELLLDAANVTIDAVLTKPVTQSTLWDALLPALGFAPRKQTRLSQRQTRVDTALIQLAGAKLLVAEDNDLNQELIVELLTSNGITSVLANDGQEALDCLAKEEFDGVLMDCQMPIMDGYTATRHIRAQAQFEHLPVLAMTANAMAGDREKALDAGMNDHIPKPLNVDELFVTIAKWVTPKNPASLHEHVQNEAHNDMDFSLFKHIDTQLGLSRTQGKSSLYKKLLYKFVSGQQDFTAQVNASLSANDPVTTARLIHTLKSVSGAIGALKLTQFAERLEQDSEHAQDKASDITASETYPLLVEELALVCSEITVQLAELVVADIDTQFDAEKAAEVLTQLIVMLNDFDMAATELIAEQRSILASKPLLSLFKKLEKQLDDYEFDEALKVAVQMQTLVANKMS